MINSARYKKPSTVTHNVVMNAAKVGMSTKLKELHNKDEKYQVEVKQIC
jgi:hypothetical protein